MVGDLKEVFFDVYCPTCAYKDCKEDDPDKPCYECLEVPANQDSHKPVNWKEKE